MPDKPVVYVEVEPSLKRRLDTEARVSGRSRSAIARSALVDYLRVQREARRRLAEAEESVCE